MARRPLAPQGCCRLLTILVAVLVIGGIIITFALAFRAPASGEAIDIGRVLQSAFGEMRKNAPALGLTALVLACIPAFLVEYASFDPATGEVDYGESRYWIAGAPGMLIGYLLQAVVVAVTVGSLDRRPAGLAPSLLLGLRRLLPILAAIILSYLAIGIGLVFFLVPGAILFTMWILLVPVIVEERAGIIASFSRSSDLTRGSRWRIFALLAIFFAIQIGVAIFAEFISTLAGSRFAAALAAAFSSGFSAILLATILASLYVEARNVKEGRGVSGLESIFQ